MEITKELSDRKIIVGLILLQLLVTLPFINSFPVDLDEPFSIFYAQQDLSEFVPFLNQGNNPPLHYILLHYWIDVFGISVWSVRGLSLLFSLLTIPISYKIGKEVVRKEYGILFVCVFIFSTFNHFHAIEARVYSLFVMLVVFAIYNIYQLLFLKKNVILSLSIWNALLMYSHYLGGVVIGLEIILLIIFYKELTKSKIIQFIIAGVISILLFTPSLIVFYNRIGDFTENGTWLNKPHWSELYGNIMRFFNFTLTLFILISLLVIFSFINRKNIKKTLITKQHIFILLSFVVPYFGMYIISLVLQPVFLDRYLLFTTPFLYLSFIILVQIALTNYKITWVKYLFLLPMIISCYYIPQTNREGDKIAQFVLKNTNKNSIIAISPPFYDLTFLYHYNQDAFGQYNDYETVMSKLNIQTVYSYRDIKLSPNIEYVFFIDANSKFLFPNNDILSQLNKNFTEVNHEVYKGDYNTYQFRIND